MGSGGSAVWPHPARCRGAPVTCQTSGRKCTKKRHWIRTFMPMGRLLLRCLVLLFARSAPVTCEKERPYVHEPPLRAHVYGDWKAVAPLSSPPVRARGAPVTGDESGRKCTNNVLCVRTFFVIGRRMFCCLALLFARGAHPLHARNAVVSARKNVPCVRTFLRLGSGCSAVWPHPVRWRRAPVTCQKKWP